LTEIPDYLLERSRERRAALGLSTGDGGESASPATSDTTPEATAAPSAAPAPVAATEVAVPSEPEPVPPYVLAAEQRPRMPIWAAPLVLFLIIWAFLYVGTLEGPPAEAEGIFAEGAEIYETSCAACHGATGGGGTGPALADGEVLLTFPVAADHLVWVAQGSSGYGNVGEVYGDPDRPGGARAIAGGMPAFGGELPAEELLAVVLYEQIEHGGAPAELATITDELIETGELEIPESFGDLEREKIGATIDLITERAIEDGLVDDVALGE
jgi:mono/diheme cytochrome c family protein